MRCVLMGADFCLWNSRTSLVAQMVKHLPTMQETWVWSLGQEDPLEKEIATQSNTLAWKIPWTEEPGRLQSMGVAKSRTRLSFNANVSRAKLEMVITHLVVLSTFETPDLHTLYHQSLVEIMKAEMLWVLSEQLWRMKEVSVDWRGFNVFPTFRKGKKKGSGN